MPNSCLRLAQLDGGDFQGNEQLPLGRLTVLHANVLSISHSAGQEHEQDQGSRQTKQRTGPEPDRATARGFRHLAQQPFGEIVRGLPAFERFLQLLFEGRHDTSPACAALVSSGVLRNRRSVLARKSSSARNRQVFTVATFIPSIFAISSISMSS